MSGDIYTASSDIRLTLEDSDPLLDPDLRLDRDPRTGVEVPGGGTVAL